MKRQDAGGAGFLSILFQEYAVENINGEYF